MGIASNYTSKLRSDSEQARLCSAVAVTMCRKPLPAACSHPASLLRPGPRSQETLKYVLKSAAPPDSTDLTPAQLKSKHEFTGFPEHGCFTQPRFQPFIILSRLQLRFGVFCLQSSLPPCVPSPPSPLHQGKLSRAVPSCMLHPTQRTQHTSFLNTLSTYPWALANTTSTP